MTTPLSCISDGRLLSRLDDLALRERCITLGILDHLAEVERRELHLKEGYSSMFSYCTGRLRYSASAANRRIRTMRCIRRFAGVRPLLEGRRVNLSTVSMVAGILNDANHARVLERIADRSQREVEAIAAEFKPRGRVRDSVRPVCVRPQPEGTSSVVAIPTLMCESDRSGRKTAAAETMAEAVGEEASVQTRPAAHKAQVATADGDSTGAVEGAKHTEVSPTTRPAERPAKQFIIRFAAGPELVRQIEAVRALLSFRVPANAPLEQVLGVVLSDFVERNDPARRAERRVRRGSGSDKAGEQVGRASAPSMQTGRASAPSHQRRAVAPARENGRAGGARTATAKTNPRAISAAARDEVFVKAGRVCEYVSPSGRRCDATMHLQIDHIVPVALGGTAKRSNLRVLCGRHNRLESDRLLLGIATPRGVARRPG